MKKLTTSLSAGIVVLAGASAQATEVSPVTLESAEVIEVLIDEGQVLVDQSGVVRVNKSLYEILKQKGVLTEKALGRSSDTDGGAKCRSGG